MQPEIIEITPSERDMLSVLVAARESQLRQDLEGGLRTHDDRRAADELDRLQRLRVKLKGK